MEMDMIVSAKMSDLKVKMTMGIEQTYSPALDDYIGDDDLDHGAVVVCRSTVTTTTTMKIEMTGFPAQTESDTSTELAVQTIQVAAANETVTVPAGTFDCCKYTYILDLGGFSEGVTYYYSDKVGNYVKQEGSLESMGGFGDGELKSYSYKDSGAGASSLFSGAGLLIIIVVIVAVVVVVSLVLMMRKRGKAVAPMPMQMPPPEMGPPPPPPPPPGA